jgi:hypothetical protein
MVGRMHNWSTRSRCPCCRKLTGTSLGLALNETASGWDNLMSRSQATQLAREGVCPWCGRRTTIVSKILLQRFEPVLCSYARLFTFAGS